MSQLDKQMQLERLKDWIAECIQKYGQAEVSWRVLRECLHDPVEEVMDKKTGLTWFDISLFTGRPAKTVTDLFEEWLKKEGYEYTDTHKQTRIYRPQRPVDRRRNQPLTFLP